MKIAAAVILFVLLAGDASQPTPAVFRFVRPVRVVAARAGNASGTLALNACAVLDADVYAHANPLVDLRLYAGGQEVPYAITFSNASAVPDSARLLNLGLVSSNRLSFDLEMPSRAYSSVDLNLNGKDFLASAKISGLKQAGDKDGVQLGTFSVFDLSSQHLGRNTTLEFAESTFPVLHIELSFTGAPGNDAFRAEPSMLTGADVPASRVAQTLYSPVALSSAIVQRPRESVTTFTIPAHVPVERVLFELDPSDHTNFNRAVTVTATPSEPVNGSGNPPQSPEQIAGEISRIRLTEGGKEIRQESLAVPAILGTNVQAPATVEIAVENGDDRPIAIRSVQLQMRERKLCFPQACLEPHSLFYGAAEVAAPVYDFGRLFDAASPAQTAMLGPEQMNALYMPAIEHKSFVERHPGLLWIALFAVVCVLGLVAFRSAKRI